MAADCEHTLHSKGTLLFDELLDFEYEGSLAAASSCEDRRSMREPVRLTSLNRYSDLALVFLRAFVGAFLICGVWDNIVSDERMQEFVAFLTKYEFVAPQFM